MIRATAIIALIFLASGCAECSEAMNNAQYGIERELSHLHSALAVKSLPLGDFYEQFVISSILLEVYPDQKKSRLGADDFGFETAGHFISSVENDGLNIAGAERITNPPLPDSLSAEEVRLITSPGQRAIGVNGAMVDGKIMPDVETLGHEVCHWLHILYPGKFHNPHWRPGTSSK